MRKYMRLALENARKAYQLGEVPVGAVLVDSTGAVIADSYNLCRVDHNPTKHAEMVVLNKAFELTKVTSLKGYSLYVTLEPCPMCAAAIIHSGISKVVFGAYDTDFGAFGSYLNLATHPYAKHLEIYGGICEKECSELIKEFFKEIRNNEH